MKRTLALFAVASLIALSVASGQEGGNEEGGNKDIEFKLQVQRARDQAQLLNNLIKENEKQKAAADKQQAPEAGKAPGQATQTAVRSHVPDSLPAGVAKGSLTYEGSTADLKFASAFIDQKDERNPLVVLVSDQKLPVENWKSEFDMMMDHTKWSGLAVFVDKDGVYRTDIHTKGRQTSVSGIFDTIIDTSVGGDATGTAKSSGSDKETKIDVSFHARK